METCLIVGLGRSGTTLLSRLIALTTTPCRFISEPFPGLSDALSPDKVDPSFVDPNNPNELHKLDKVITALGGDNPPLSENQLFRIERNEVSAKALLIKEVHALLTLPLLESIDNYKAVVITRDITRVADSYFFGHEKNIRKYLIEESRFLKGYINGSQEHHLDLLDEALKKVNDEVIRYIKRPSLFSSEILRWSAVALVINEYLKAWSDNSEKIHHVTFEEICANPHQTCHRLYNALNLELDALTDARISEMTSGKSSGYYSTEKNSQEILKQSYRALKDNDVRTISHWGA